MNNIMQPFDVIMLYSTSVMNDHNDRQCTTWTSRSQDSAVPACISWNSLLQKKRIPLSAFVAVHLQVMLSNRDMPEPHTIKPLFQQYG